MSVERYKYLNTLFSFAMKNQESCLEEFVLSDGMIKRKIQEKLYRISNLLSISLDMLEKIMKKKKKKKKKTKDGVFPSYEMEDGFPSWIIKKYRKLFESKIEMHYDLVMARDGTGNCTSITQAIEEGIYVENVQVSRNKINLMFVGDGIGKTIVISNRSVGDGWTLTGSSTVGKFLDFKLFDPSILSKVEMW
ncbi:hypothetical protein MKX03_035744 [Papaver bracteatum]|nr:hypothetical protein MKX03_035744 [Papaver bracteatum]